MSNLNAWKDEQKDSHIDLLKKHNQAKQTVSNLQSEIINLKQQLEDKEKCLSEAEAIIAEHSAQKYEERGCLQQEDALLKSVKSVLENEFGCFQESDKQVVNLSGDNKQVRCPCNHIHVFVLYFACYNKAYCHTRVYCS